MTATDLYELWERTLAEINTTQNGVLRPVRNFEKMVDAISNELFRERFALFEKKQMNIDELSPFVKTRNMMVTILPGMPYDTIAYPADYEYFGACRVLLNMETLCGCLLDKADVVDGDGICKGMEDADLAELREKYSGSDYTECDVNKVDMQRWGATLSHSFDAPTATSPAMTQIQDKFRIAPKKLGVVVLDYLVSPRKVKFAYTLDAEDNIIYDPANSIAPEWSRVLMDEFVVRIKQKYASFQGDYPMVEEAIIERKNKV